MPPCRRDHTPTGTARPLLHRSRPGLSRPRPGCCRWHRQLRSAPRPFQGFPSRRPGSRLPDPSRGPLPIPARSGVPDLAVPDLFGTRDRRLAPPPPAVRPGSYQAKDRNRPTAWGLGPLLSITVLSPNSPPCHPVPASPFRSLHRVPPLHVLIPGQFPHKGPSLPVSLPRRSSCLSLASQGNFTLGAKRCSQCVLPPFQLTASPRYSSCGLPPVIPGADRSQP